MVVNFHPTRERSPDRVWLDDADCERMTRPEFEAARCLLGAVSYAAHANDGLSKRLNLIPDGPERMAGALQSIRDIADDVVGTMTSQQAKQMQHVMSDMEIRMVPKMAPISQSVLFDKDIAKGLIDIAKDRCRDCVEDNNSCKGCELYKILEAVTPPNDFESGLICPYSLAEWEE